MAEANYLTEGCSIDVTAVAAITAGQVMQVHDGRAAFAPTAIAAGDVGAVTVKGIVSAAKTTSMVILKGTPLYWDHSANKVHLLHRNDRDFYVGVAQEDATSAATTVKVALNVKPVYTLSLASGFVSVPISTAGWPFVHGSGEGVNLGFDLTAEAQKLDALSHRGTAVNAGTIVDALICINDGGDNAAVDINIGLASGTHATDCDSITESLFVHIDGASTNIALESDDGTTEVAATDTTIDFVAGTPFLAQFDLRDLSDIQCYINGVLALGGSAFKLNAATGPLKLLAHMEKTADNSPGNVSVMLLGARTFGE